MLPPHSMTASTRTAQPDICGHQPQPGHEGQQQVCLTVHSTMPRTCANMQAPSAAAAILTSQMCVHTHAMFLCVCVCARARTHIQTVSYASAHHTHTHTCAPDALPKPLSGKTRLPPLQGSPALPTAGRSSPINDGSRDQPQQQPSQSLYHPQEPQEPVEGVAQYNFPRNTTPNAWIRRHVATHPTPGSGPVTVTAVTPPLSRNGLFGRSGGTSDAGGGEVSRRQRSPSDTWGSMTSVGDLEALDSILDQLIVADEAMRQVGRRHMRICGGLATQRDSVSGLLMSYVSCSRCVLRSLQIHTHSC